MPASACTIKQMNLNDCGNFVSSQPVILSAAKNLWITEEPGEKSQRCFASLNVINSLFELL